MSTTKIKNKKLKIKNFFSVNQPIYQRNSAGAPTKSGRVVGGLSSTRGVSLLLAFLIMSVILSIGLGISLILIQQNKMMGGIGESVIAFFASNTGVEKTLYEISQGAEIGSHYEETLENGSNYITDIIGPGEDCSALTYCIKSIGIYKDTKRAIHISR